MPGRPAAGPLGPAAAVTALLVALLCAVDIGTKWHVPVLVAIYQDKAFWWPAAALTGMCVVVVWRGPPRGMAQVSAFIALNLVLIEAIQLSVQLELYRACWWTLDLVLRLATAACWVAASCGVIAVPVWLWRRVRPGRAPAWLRWWFASTVFIAFAEAGARTIERPPPAPAVKLPAHWSSRDRSGGEFRIAAIGESSMIGFPYEPKVDIPTVCRAHLEARYPARTFTVENVAVGGIDLRTAIAQLERLPTRPDLILLYSGHNEEFFDVESDVNRPKSSVPLVDLCFQWSAAYRAFSKAAERCYSVDRDQPGAGRRLFDSAQYLEGVAQERLERFRQTLVQFARGCRQQGVSAIWFVPAAGEGTFEPNRSCSRAPLSAGRQEAICGKLAEARGLERAGRWQEAEQVYRGLLNDEPEFAEFHFRLGESLVQQHRIPEAKRSFRAAIDCDGHPCQATSSYRQCIMDVAQQERIPLIDAQQELEAVTASGLLDRTVMLDHVHMSLRGYLALGRAAAELAVAESLVGEGATAGVPDAVDYATFLAEADFDARDLATAYDRIAFALDYLCRHRYDPARRHAEADQYRRWAEGLRTGAIQPGEQGTESLTQSEPGGVRLPSLN